MTTPIDTANRSSDVMALVARFVDFLRTAERTHGGTDEQAEQVIREGLAMGYRLHRIADLLELSGDLDGANFIRRALTPEGLAELKAVHDETPPALPAVFV